MNRQEHDDVEHAVIDIALGLRRYGLETPALMLYELWSPLSYFGEQALLVMRPLVPPGRMLQQAQSLLRTLQDEHKRNLLRDLLQAPDS